MSNYISKQNSIVIEPERTKLGGGGGRGYCSVNPIAYGILRLSQLRGWDFYPTPQKTMLKLFN